jgi:tetratricopeptide (TPR) repeat protein
MEKFEDLINLASQHVHEKEFIKAIECYKVASQMKPNNEKIYFNIGVSYIYLKEYYNAIEYLSKAISLNNKYVTAYINIAISYKRIKEYNKAIKSLSIASKIDSTEPDIFYNLANLYSVIEEYDISLELYHKTLKLNSNYYKAYHGIALVYNHQMNYKLAMKYLEKTLQINKHYPDAIFAKSLIQLRNKEYIEGWINYEKRWEANNPLKKFSYNIPFYDGEDLTEKNVLIQEEQGFGDNLQFIRYITYLKTKNPKNIYIAVRKELYNFFKLIEEVTVVTNNDTLFDIDYVTSILSFPRIFKTTFNTIPNKTPYLPLPLKDNISHKIIQKTNKLKVGFAFQGNKDHKNDRYRSIPEEIFKELFSLTNIEFYDLQINHENSTHTFDNVYDCNPVVEDFCDSSLIVNKVDIIITIDSVLAHLAGGLGKETFLLLPQNAEWRWFEDINYSPWYPTLKLFRQKQLGFWIDTIEEVKEELKKLT